MTKIKLCGLTRPEDIRTANALMPDYVGFVFARGSRRCVTPERAAELKALLIPSITAVGVFVNERPERVAELMRGGVIDAAQLHGDEDDEYNRSNTTGTPIQDQRPFSCSVLKIPFSIQ